MTGSHCLEQGKKNSVKIAIVALKGLFPGPGAQPSHNVEGGEKNHKPQGEVQPTKDGDAEINASVRPSPLHGYAATLLPFLTKRQVLTPPKAKFWMEAMVVRTSISSGV